MMTETRVPLTPAPCDGLTLSHEILRRQHRLTADTCDPATGCVHIPDASFCEVTNPCFTAVCDPTSGCTQVPVNCDDNNPCTIDSCSAGSCLNIPHNLCNDNLRCTDDICVPDPIDVARFTCEWIVDVSNCGVNNSCTTSLCSIGRDCEQVPHDDLCPDDVAFFASFPAATLWGAVVSLTSGPRLERHGAGRAASHRISVLTLIQVN